MIYYTACDFDCDNDCNNGMIMTVIAAIDGMNQTIQSYRGEIRLTDQLQTDSHITTYHKQIDSSS